MKIKIYWMKKKCNRFDAFLTKKNQNVIDNLNLKELEEDKKNFEENMSQFEKANMENNTDTISEFITEKSFLFFFKVFDKKNTLTKYKNKVTNFFNNKDNILSIIEKNKNKAIDNIEGIVNKFQNKIQGFKNNFEEFERIVKEVEEFIYKEFGIKE